MRRAFDVRDNCSRKRLSKNTVYYDLVSQLLVSLGIRYDDVVSNVALLKRVEALHLSN